MSSASASSSSTGIGLVSILGVAFIVLKLCHVIDWSWWWVLSPFWISAIIWAVILTAIFGFAIASGARGKRQLPKHWQGRT